MSSQIYEPVSPTSSYSIHRTSRYGLVYKEVSQHACQTSTSLKNIGSEHDQPSAK